MAVRSCVNFDVSQMFIRSLAALSKSLKTKETEKEKQIVEVLLVTIKRK